MIINVSVLGQINEAKIKISALVQIGYNLTMSQYYIFNYSTLFTDLICNLLILFMNYTTETIYKAILLLKHANFIHFGIVLK